MLSRYFGFTEPVDRRTYLRGRDRAGTRKIPARCSGNLDCHSPTLTPLDYLIPLLTVRGQKLSAFPTELLVALIVWTLPFIWIGVSMRLRRAIDAAGGV